MKIIYFTTAQDEKDYKSFMKIWNYPLNSSNQNFHNKLIRCLAIENDVEVISVRPFSRTNTSVKKLNKETKEINGITWHYLKRSGSKLVRNLNVNSQIKNVLNNIDLSNSIFLTDTINPSVVGAVAKVNKKYKRPIIGICTDSPSNISGTTRSYTMYLLSKTNNYDGYISLTSSLADLFNPEAKPTFVFEGIIEDNIPESKKETETPYFFFGGALMEKYGIYNLIEAFKKLNNPNVDLYICGHHGDVPKLKSICKENSNIKYLGLLPVSRVLQLEQQAIASINPRPYSEDLDRFSVPSKTIEYMSAGRPVISVKNTVLMEKFPRYITWLDSSSTEEIERGLKLVLKMGATQQADYGEKIKKQAMDLYSLTSVSKQIQPFLLQFVKKDVVD